MVVLYIYLAVAATLPWALVKHLFTGGHIFFRITAALVASLAWGAWAYMLIRNDLLTKLITTQRGSG